jgi:hypothetical protein
VICTMPGSGGYGGMKETRNAYRILVWNHLEDGVDVRIILRTGR